MRATNRPGRTDFIARQKPTVCAAPLSLLDAMVRLVRCFHVYMLIYGSCSQQAIFLHSGMYVRSLYFSQ